MVAMLVERRLDFERAATVAKREVPLEGNHSTNQKAAPAQDKTTTATTVSKIDTVYLEPLGSRVRYLKKGREVTRETKNETNKK